MSEELKCMNCSIGDFKNELCDCNNGFCKEFKSIGRQEDFFNAVMQRIRPQGEWKRRLVDNGFNADWVCSECGYRVKTDFVSFNYCPNCGARMKGADNEDN